MNISLILSIISIFIIYFIFFKNEIDDSLFKLIIYIFIAIILLFLAYKYNIGILII